MSQPESEIRRLLDVMPASGRMKTKIVSKPEQSQVIDSPFPQPWAQEHPIYINFDLWRRLPQSQRDMLILSTVSWLIGIKWFKPDLYQGVVVAGILGSITQIIQGDAVGVVVATGLAAFAGSQILSQNRSPQIQLSADDAAMKIAQRRGYTEVEASENLLSAIEAVAKLEGRPSLNFTELLRSQNLRAIAGLSPLSVPDTIKRQ